MVAIANALTGLSNAFSHAVSPPWFEAVISLYFKTGLLSILFTK